MFGSTTEEDLVSVNKKSTYLPAQYETLTVIVLGRTGGCVNDVVPYILWDPVPDS